MVSCSLFKEKKTIGIASKDNNVCKKLEGDVLLYGIFIDSKYTHPFSEFDIKSTEDSVIKAINWLENRAKKEGRSLNIKAVFHEKKGKKPLTQKLRKKTLSKTLFVRNGVKNIDKWADQIAKKAFTSLPKSESTMINTNNKGTNRERLIAKLRDIYKVDNVGLVFFINNYHISEVSVAIHTNEDSPEYAIVSYKQIGVIIHEFMHLFGAIDLYHDPLKSKKENKKLSKFRRRYPNTIMSESALANLDSIAISPITKYLVGWQNSLNKEDTKLLFGRNIDLSNY